LTLRIFITGSVGFLGRRFSEHAIAMGHDVLTCPGRLHAIEKNDLAGADCILHLAAAGVSPKQVNWENAFQTNVIDTSRFFENAAIANVKRWIVAGTFAEYGRSADLYQAIPPQAALFPSGAYACSKAASFLLLQGLAKKNQSNLSYSRIFSAFGDGQYEGCLWPSLKNAALAGEDFRLTDGTQIRDFIPVEKVVAELLSECTNATFEDGIIRVRNIASGAGQTVRDFATHWWNHFNASGKLIFGGLPSRSDEPKRYVGDPNQVFYLDSPSDLNRSNVD